MANIICIYHGDCADGFSSAWVVREALGDSNVEFHPGVHQTDPPDVTGKHVYLVDFSYKRNVIEDMLKKAESMIILDHHASALDDLGDLITSGDVGGEFDTGHSGAMVCWRWFFKGQKPPRMLYHIEDRDLFCFDLEDTFDIHAAVFSLEYTWENWDWLMREADLSKLREDGKAINRKQTKDINEFMEKNLKWMTIGDYEVPALNLPYFFASEAGHELAKKGPFGVCYWDNENGRTFSLRSTEGGVDVSQVAAQYGGGGHRGAAGFFVNKDHDLAKL